MIDRLLINFCLILLAFWSLSFSWPVEKGRLTSTFCESRGDHFHDGIDLVCPDDRALSPEKGKLLYFWDKSIFPLEPYPGGGNYKVILHPGNIVSIYMHLHDFLKPASEYDRGAQVGTIGNTGHSFAKHLHFSLLDVQNRKSLNPLSFLKGDIRDTEKPKIEHFYIRIKERLVQLRDGSDVRFTRHYPMLVHIKDSVTGRERVGIYRIVAIFNGSKVLDISFDSLSISRQGLVAGKDIFSDLFDEKGYYKISGLKYRTGENRFKVYAYDYAGNRADKEFRINVRLDIDQLE